MSGTLTIKGRSRDVTVPVTMEREAGGTSSGTFRCCVSSMPSAKGPWSDIETVADEVQVRFRIFVAGA